MTNASPNPTVAEDVDDIFADLLGSAAPELDAQDADWLRPAESGFQAPPPVGWPAQVRHRSLVEPHLIADVDGERLPDLSAEDAEAVQCELDKHLSLDRKAASLLTEMLLRSASWVARNFDPMKTQLSRPTYLRARLLGAVRSFFAQIRPRAARRAHIDQVERDRARNGGEAALLRYLDQHAMVRLDQLRRQAKSWWHVPGMTYDDFRETARVELAIAFLEDGLESRERAGHEATVRFLYSLRRKLRAAARTYLWEEPFSSDYMRRPSDVATVEEAIIDREDQLARGSALDRALPQLTRLQRRWIDAFRADIEANGELCLARAAESVGRSRAAASLARRSIEEIVRQYVER